MFRRKYGSVKPKFHEIKYMSILIEDDELFGDKIRNSIKKEFEDESVCTQKYLKTKIKSYKGKIITNVHDNGTHIEDSHCISLSVTTFDSVFIMDKSYYPHLLLEECKYFVKEEKISRYIIDHLIMIKKQIYTLTFLKKWTKKFLKRKKFSQLVLILLRCYS